MSRITIMIIRKDSTEIADDTITIRAINNTPGVFRVSYVTPDIDSTKRFVAHTSRVLNYLDDVLRSLALDTDPFEKIQLSTSIHPSVIYHIADLGDETIQSIMMNMCEDALALDVTSA